MNGNKAKKVVKNGIAMLLSMLLVFILLWFFAGEFNTNGTRTDIVSLQPHNIIAESDSWALSVPEKEERTPYVIYESSGHPSKAVTVRGVFHYNIRVNDGKEILSGKDQIEKELVMDRHFVVGEKRWYFTTDYAGENYDWCMFRITWQEAGKTQEEYVCSSDLPQEKKEEIQDWIDSGAEPADQR